MGLPPEGTDRYFLKYSCGNDIHTIMMRTLGGGNPAGARVSFHDFMNALSPILYLCTLISCDHAAAGSNVRLPIGLGGLTSSYGSGTPTPVQSVFGLAFPGRSATGHKARVYVMPTKLQGDNNYKYDVAENTAVAAAILVLNQAAAGFWMAIDGSDVGWYNYATSKQNDHYVNKRRGA